MIQAEPEAELERAKRQIERVVGVANFGVGLLLITYGTFWTVEGFGVFVPSGSLSWPGGDFALVVLLAAWTAVALLAVRVLRSRSGRHYPRPR